MYRPSAFAVDDIAVLHEVIRKRVFVTLAAVMDSEIAFAYAPVVLDTEKGKGALRFHLAIGNPLATLNDGTRVQVSIMASDAYVSPDWYAEPVTVPTWNYVAVEGAGRVRRFGAGLRPFLRTPKRPSSRSPTAPTSTRAPSPWSRSPRWWPSTRRRPPTCGRSARSKRMGRGEV